MMITATDSAAYSTWSEVAKVVTPDASNSTISSQNAPGVRAENFGVKFFVQEGQQRHDQVSKNMLSNLEKNLRTPSVSDLIMLQADTAKYSVTVQLLSGIADQAAKSIKSLTERS